MSLPKHSIFPDATSCYELTREQAEALLDRIETVNRCTKEIQGILEAAVPSVKRRPSGHKHSRRLGHV